MQHHRCFVGFLKKYFFTTFCDSVEHVLIDLGTSM